MAFYPDTHHGKHMCDTTLGPCPGPKPDDYVIIRVRPDVAYASVASHYINHGNTWQSFDKVIERVKIAPTGYIILDNQFFERFGKDKP
jgi:hypothetical protein